MMGRASPARAAVADVRRYSLEQSDSAALCAKLLSHSASDSANHKWRHFKGLQSRLLVVGHKGPTRRDDQCSRKLCRV